MNDPVDKFVAGLERSASGRPRVALVHGDLVIAEPAARRVAGALARALGLDPAAVESHRRPPSLGPALQNLRTFSMFASAKVVLAVDTALFADRGAAGGLVDEAEEALPLKEEGGPLAPRERQAASRLLQALRLFDLDPYAGTPERALGELPAWALEGGPSRRTRRGKRQVEDLRAGLAALLEAARREGLQGMGEGDLAGLSDLLRDGLPEGHALVLAESAVARDNPLVRQLADQGAVLAVGSVEADRAGWQGLDLLAAELERQTGMGIAPDALAELARRTLRQDSEGSKRSKGPAGAQADSTARFAGEYRKLAQMAPAGGRIDRRLVAQSVEDRGEEDVWKIFDAIAEGRGGEALDRLHRMMGSADDPLAARLGFFSLLASFCRQLTAIRGMMRVARVPAGEGSYPRFKDRWAPALQGEIATGGKNPLAGLHPFRLHRAYLAASRLPEPLLARLPSDLLETELQIKGESDEADVALARLVARLSAAASARRA